MSGVLWLSSKSDTRWNVTVQTESICFTAGMPPDLEAELKKKDKELGTRPEDLEWGGMKD